MADSEMNAGPSKRAVPRETETPEVVGKLIRYALSELSTDNAHHDFEHLCRHLARRRICSNVLPATGPVSGGGDKGADFETLQVESGFGASAYWRLAAPGKVLFACSLERNLKKKIKADVKAAAEFGETLDRMYFFYNRPIKVGDRNKFKEAALKEHGIKLEIVDGNAIAEFLADPELLWIAEKFLSLPSEVSLPSPGKAPSWYSALLATAESDLPRNSETFYQLKSAVRHASREPERHSEVPKFIQRLRLFRSHPNRTIARKAFYEEFVAALRGLNAAEGYEAQVIDYLCGAAATEIPEELDDATIILSYANGACVRGILNIDVSFRRRIRDELLAKLDSLISSHPGFVTCSLLFTKGHILLISAALDDDPDGKAAFPLARAADRATGPWSILLGHARDLPLFPVERLLPLVSFVFPHVTSDTFATFVKHLDQITAGRAGAGELAEQHIERASALLDADELLRALHEFHEALRLSHNLPSQSEAIRVCLQLSALYQHLGLYHAAKYYGLAAAYAALQLPEDALRKMAAVGLAKAAEADYASGASLLFFLTSRIFMRLAEEFAIAGTKPFREEQWAKVDYYALLLTRASKIISDDCHSRCLELLRYLGGEDTYTDTGARLDEMFGELDRTGLAKLYANQGIGTPFSDHAPSRATSWKQLGITWRVEWASNFESERHGEALCAVLQIVLAALTGTEFSIITTRAAITINATHSGEETVEQEADNDMLRFLVKLDPTRGISFEGHIAIVYYILAACSAIPAGDFTKRFEQEFSKGLPQRIGVYISPTEAFRQFYSEKDYERLHKGDPTDQPEIEPSRTREEMSEVSEVHPQFNEQEALQLIRNRYKNMSKMIPYTLRRLSEDKVFLELLSGFRGSGWKDWHILLAVTNIRINTLVDMHDPNYEELTRARAREGEHAADAPAPSDAFDEQHIRRSLEMSQLSTLTSMGFRADQMTPNFSGIDAFLRRFKYWDLDVPHRDPFAITSAAS